MKSFALASLTLVSSFVLGNNVSAEEIKSFREGDQVLYSVGGVVSNDETCLKPVAELKQKPEWLENKFASTGTFRGHQLHLPGRYLVADLDRRDESGSCKGVQEVIPDVVRKSLPHFKPVSRPANEKNCFGQTLSLCQKHGNRVKLVARFATSSGKYENYKNYYAPINVIKTRHGDGRRADPQRDQHFKGSAPGSYFSDEKVLKFQRVDPMYNFMNFVPTVGFKGETQNGIHRYPDGGRPVLGKPASHGCMRTSDLGTRFIRDWTPLGAKFYILHRTTVKP